MAKKKTRLKVTSSGKTSHKKMLTAVAKIEGVEKLEIDGTKGVLTVIGEVEPVPIFKALKKIGVKSEIMSVGPPKPAGHSPFCCCMLCWPHLTPQQQQAWCPGSGTSNAPFSSCSGYGPSNVPFSSYGPSNVPFSSYGPSNVPFSSCCNNSHCNNQCQLIAVRYPSSHDTGQCSIL